MNYIESKKSKNAINLKSSLPFKDEYIEFLSIIEKGSSLLYEKASLFRKFANLYEHYLNIFLIYKGFYSKNIPPNTLQTIWYKFCDIMNFPKDIFELVKIKEKDLDQLDRVNISSLKSISLTSENDFIHVFSQLAKIQL